MHELDPAYARKTVRSAAALPFASKISEREDPDRIAAPMAEAKFYAALRARTPLAIVSSTEVARALAAAGLSARMQKFYENWVSDQTDVDEEFVRQAAARLKVDTLIAGGVDVWDQKVEAKETRARTRVGLVIGFFDGATGKHLWQGRDENFKDGTRGAPPDYSAILDLVVEALASAFPAGAP